MGCAAIPEAEGTELLVNLHGPKLLEVGISGVHGTLLQSTKIFVSAVIEGHTLPDQVLGSPPSFSLADSGSDLISLPF